MKPLWLAGSGHLGVSSPAENLAADEALLEYCEGAEAPGVLRFWQPRDWFVVLGYSKRLAEEVVPAGVPVLRRCSGGGTVLQGPGCLDYALVLPVDAQPELGTITGANRWIMERNRAVLAPLAAGTVTVQGHTDLTLGSRKFSGNAQRRLKRCLLFHGVLLIDMDLGRISHALRLPKLQPEYRQSREHHDFLVNLAVPPEQVMGALAEAWGAHDPLPGPVRDQVSKRTGELVRERYSQKDWNERF